MKRGLFQEIIPDEFINASPRNWNISLLKSLDIWGELAYSDSLLSNYKRRNSSNTRVSLTFVMPAMGSNQKTRNNILKCCFIGKNRL